MSVRYRCLNNRFAALASSGTDEESSEGDIEPAPPERDKQGVVQCMYSMTHGKQRVQQDGQRPHAANLFSPGCAAATSINAISFFGRCFQCQYMSHSQKYCPLRLCKLCRQYGHSEAVCKKQRLRAQNSSTRAFLEGVNGSMTGFLLEASTAEEGVADTGEEEVDERFEPSVPVPFPPADWEAGSAEGSVS